MNKYNNNTYECAKHVIYLSTIDYIMEILHFLDDGALRRIQEQCIYMRVNLNGRKVLY